MIGVGGSNDIAGV